MARKATRLAAAAALAASVSLPILTPADAATIPNCRTEAGPAGPEGSRWRYRIEWPSQRKCWRLVLKDGAARTAAARPAKEAEPAQGDTDDDDETTATTPAPRAAAPKAVTPRATNLNVKPVEPPPAKVVEAPPAKVVEEPPAESVKVKTLITRNVSNAEDAPAADQQPAAPPEAPAPAAQNEPPVMAAPSTPAPVVTKEAAKAASTEGSPTTWRLLLAALALLVFCGAAFVIVFESMRRRSDVLHREMEDGQRPASADAPVYEDPADADQYLATHDADQARLQPGAHEEPRAEYEEPLEEPEATYPPLPPLSLEPKRDDVDEAIRRLLQRTRRHAA